MLMLGHAIIARPQQFRVSAEQAIPLDEDGLVRVLLFVRPMQPLAAEADVVVDTVHHMMQPLAVFEPIHQQVFNTRRAVQHRRRVQELEHTVRRGVLVG